MSDNIPNPLSLLEKTLRKEFSNCPLMPCRENKCPLYKHAGIPIENMWSKWEEFSNVTEHGVLVILREDLIVIDIDDMNYVKEFEEEYPFLLETAIQNTKKGRHYFFKRTPLCDELKLFDGARQFVNCGKELPVDIKTKCATGTGGCIAVFPSPGKIWHRPLYDFTRETLPCIPDAFVREIVDKKKNKTYIERERGQQNNGVRCRTIYKMHPPTLVDNDPKLTKMMKTSLNIDKVRLMIYSLPKEKSKNYGSWMEVMWILQNLLLQHNLYDKYEKCPKRLADEEEIYGDIFFENDNDGFQKKLYIIFDDFSRQYGLKYNMQTCLDKWCAPYRIGLGMGSLCNMLRLCSYVDYNDVQMRELERIVNDSCVSHMDIARMLAEYVREKFICAGDNRWYYFQDSLWHEDINCNLLTNVMHEKFRSDLESLCRYENVQISEQKEILASEQDFEEFKERARKILSRATSVLKKANSIINKIGDIVFASRVLKSMATFLVYPDFMIKLDSNPRLIAFTNGVWDLIEKRFRRTLPSDLISRSVNYAYTEKKDEVAARKVMEYLEKMHPYPEQRSYMIRMFARNLYGDNAESYCHLHAGVRASAANGKSTFFEILEGTLGKYMRKFPVEYILGKRSEPGKPLPEFEHWRGTRIIYCSEPTREDRINSGILKDMTGGETMCYRRLGENTIHVFKPMFKIHLMCNDTPVLDGGDEGIRRRIRKIDYISSFKDSDQADPARHIYKRDTHAVNELKRNTVYRMEFLRLLFENFDLNDELKMPRSILKPTLQLFSRNDPIRTFMDLYVERGTGEDYLQLSTLKDLYKESEIYVPHVKMDKEAIEKVINIDCIPIKYIDGKTRRNIFIGYRLIPDNEENVYSDEENQI